MSKRYYCDYCDKSFKDMVEGRKKHLQGTQHIRNRKLHYREYRDLETLLKEESSKPECRKFMQNRNCPHGDHCNFTHYSQMQLSEIKKQVENEKLKKQMRDLPTVESWLNKRIKRMHPTEASLVQPSYPPNSPDLPISLRPINFCDVVNIEFNEWG